MKDIYTKDLNIGLIHELRETIKDLELKNSILRGELQIRTDDNDSLTYELEKLQEDYYELEEKYNKLEEEKK